MASHPSSGRCSWPRAGPGSRPRCRGPGGRSVRRSSPRWFPSAGRARFGRAPQASAPQAQPRALVFHPGDAAASRPARQLGAVGDETSEESNHPHASKSGRGLYALKRIRPVATFANSTQENARTIRSVRAPSSALRKPWKLHLSVDPLGSEADVDPRPEPEVEHDPRPRSCSEAGEPAALRWTAS
jgi:hypothetical protein